MESVKTKIDVDRIVWHAQQRVARIDRGLTRPRIADALALIGASGLASVLVSRFGENHLVR